MKIPAFFAVALALSASAFGQASPPAAPSLTAGAEFKGLRFDWETVPGASWYQLEYQPNQKSAFAQVGDDLRATATSTGLSFPLHLYNWTYARYRLAACNAAGCTRSAEVSVSGLRRDAVGYFKSSHPVDNGAFGYSTDITPDGYTLATTAPGDTFGMTGTAKGRIFVFHRGADREWVQRARIDARTDTTYNDYVELHVSISASGKTVAVAIPYQVVGPPAARRGVVDIYFLRNGVYSPTRLPRGALDDMFSADLDDSGSILAVRGRTGLQEVTAIYQIINGTWATAQTIPSTNETCWNVKLSGDGKKVVATCRSGGTQGQRYRDYLRVLSGINWSARSEIDLDLPDLSDSHASHDHNGLGLDRTGDTIAVQTRDEGPFGESTAKVKVFRLNAGFYQLVTELQPGAWNPSDDLGGFGQSISISGDGQTMAIGHTGDYGTGYGPRAAPLNPGTRATGAVYVYRLSGSWKLANMVKPNNVSSNAAAEFGKVTSLSGTGKTLIVGVPGEDSWAKGIGGDWANAGRPNSGAVFMY